MFPIGLIPELGNHVACHQNQVACVTQHYTIVCRATSRYRTTRSFRRANGFVLFARPEIKIIEIKARLRDARYVAIVTLPPVLDKVLKHHHMKSQPKIRPFVQKLLMYSSRVKEQSICNRNSER
jgi:hypothetical protein